MRRIAKKKIPLSKLKQLRAQVIFKRDGGRCVRCGSDKGISPSHVYPQGRYPRMAWIMINIKTLCWSCHFNWWHKHPLEAKEWFDEKYPGRAEQLKEISKQHLPALDHNKIKEYLEQFI